jgi:prevent-host-death family protein
MTELARNTRKVMRPVTTGGKTVVLTEHGRAAAKIVPHGPVDYPKALKLLRAIGPVDFKPRM